MLLICLHTSYMHQIRFCKELAVFLVSFLVVELKIFIFSIKEKKV